MDTRNYNIFKKSWNLKQGMDLKVICQTIQFTLGKWASASVRDSGAAHISLTRPLPRHPHSYGCRHASNCKNLSAVGVGP